MAWQPAPGAVSTAMILYAAVHGPPGVGGAGAYGGGYAPAFSGALVPFSQPHSLPHSLAPPIVRRRARR